MKLGYADFPNGVWDGTCPQYHDRNIDKNPDFYMSDRVTEEIQAVEQWIIDRSGVWDTLQPWGPADSLLTVRSDDGGLAWRGLAAGTGIELLYEDDTITITSTGGGHTQNTDLYLDTPITNVLYVDNKRGDTYTASGNITKPFKTLQTALNAVAASSETNRYEIRVAAGADYAGAVDFNKDRVVLTGEGEPRITGAITINSAAAKFSGLEITGGVTCGLDDTFRIEVDHCKVSGAAWDIEAANGVGAEFLYFNGGTFGSDLTATAVKVAWVEPGTIQNSTLVFDNCDSLKIVGSTLLTSDLYLTNGTQGTIASCASDGAVTCTLNSGSVLLGDASTAGFMSIVEGGGLYTCTTQASHVMNDSTVFGETVKDALEAIGENTEFIDTIAGENLKAGQAVYIKAADGLAYLASATTNATSKVCGFCKLDANASSPALIIPNGGMIIANWTAATGFVNLVVGDIYFLSATFGRITTVAPVAGYVVSMGMALATDTFNIEIKTRVRI